MFFTTFSGGQPFSQGAGGYYVNFLTASSGVSVWLTATTLGLCMFQRTVDGISFVRVTFFVTSAILTPAPWKRGKKLLNCYLLSAQKNLTRL
jgi:hypothetical protein